MLPAAGVTDHGDAQNAGGAIEVEEISGAGARAVLEDEVAIEQHAFDFGEKVVIPVEVAPARLHHADGGIGEVVYGARKEVGRRDEIGVEDGDQLPGGGQQPFLERAGFESVAIGAVVILDGVVKSPVPIHQGAGKGRGVVGGIVQHLDLEQILGVVHLDDFFDQALHHVALVEKRQLNGDAGQLVEAFRRLGGLLLFVLEIGADDIVAVQAVDGEDDEDGEVGDEHRPIEPRQLMNSSERVVEDILNQPLGGRTVDQQGQQ